MPRRQISDQLWIKLKQLLLDNDIYETIGLRFTVEGILYKLRAGCPWRDIPDYFGNWNSTHKRFNEWSLRNKLKDIFLLSNEHENEWTYIDGSIVKAHQHSSGAAHGAQAAIGKSVARNSTKIHLAVDAMGLPICL